MRRDIAADLGGIISAVPAHRHKLHALFVGKVAANRRTPAVKPAHSGLDGGILGLELKLILAHSALRAFGCARERNHCHECTGHDSSGSHNPILVPFRVRP